MLEFLSANIGTIIVGACLAAVVVTIAAVMIKNRRKGKTSCGCGCENCPSAGLCHKK